jgi:hypothetical protein
MGCRSIACFYMSLRKLEGDNGDEQLMSRQWREYLCSAVISDMSCNLR